MKGLRSVISQFTWLGNDDRDRLLKVLGPVSQGDTGVG